MHARLQRRRSHGVRLGETRTTGVHDRLLAPSPEIARRVCTTRKWNVDREPPAELAQLALVRYPVRCALTGRRHQSWVRVHARRPFVDGAGGGGKAEKNGRKRWRAGIEGFSRW